MTAETPPPSEPAAPDASPAARRNEHIALVALLVFVLLVFIPAFSCGYTNWDDPEFCLQSADVENPDFVHIFDPHTWVIGDWTPLATVSYAAERSLFGADPWVPHTTNVLLHLIAVWLVHRLLRDVGFGPWQSLGVALIYGVHPFQVESVLWISARKNLLMAVFTLACLRSYVAGHHVRTTCWFALSLCSKATAVGFPLIAAAAQWFAVGVPRSRRTWIWIGIWTGMAVARASISMAAQAFPVAKIAAKGLAGRMAYMGSVITTQLRQLFAPTDLSVLYDPPRRSWSDPVLLAQWALVVAVLAVLVLMARRDRRLAWIGVFGLVVLGPTLNVFPGPCWQADRYLQLPLIALGAFILLMIRPLSRIAAWLPAAAFLTWTGAVLVPLTIEREGVWKDSEALWLDARTKTPTSAVAWDWTGLGYADKKQYGEAVKAFRRALELYPENTLIALNLAFALFGDHRDAEAEAKAYEVLEMVKRDPREVLLWGGEAHALIGGIRARQGRLDEAGAAFAEAMRMSPESIRVKKWLKEFAGQGLRNR